MLKSKTIKKLQKQFFQKNKRYIKKDYKKGNEMGKNFKVIVKEIELIKPDIEPSMSPDKLKIRGFANKFKDENGNVVIDRSKESVLPSAYDLENFQKNPILLFQHNPNEPIGKVIKLNLTEQGLEIEAEVYHEANPKAFTLIKNQIIKAFSIGFRGLDYVYDEQNDIWYWTKVELLEVSIVSIPDNQDSLFSEIVNSPCETGACLFAIRDYKKKGLKMDKNTQKTKAIKNSVISDTAWSEVDKTKLGQDLAELGNKSYINEAYLVVGDYEKRSTWKFPHHEYKAGDLIVNRNGVVSAFAALQGARNNPKISIAEKSKAAKHLLKHYRELKKQGFVEEIPTELENMAKEFEEELVKTYEDLENSEVKEETKNTEEAKEPENVEETEEQKEIHKEEVLEFIEKNKKDENGLNTLLELYAILEENINNGLKELLKTE